MVAGSGRQPAQAAVRDRVRRGRQPPALPRPAQGRARHAAHRSSRTCDSASRSRTCARWACPPQCANSGRLFINGAFYGLYTNLERPDKEFITRIFPGAGPRRSVGRRLAARRSTRTTMALPHPRLDAFWAAKTPSRSPRSPTWTRRCSNGRARRCWPTPTATGSATATSSSTTTRRAAGSGCRTISTRRSTGSTRTSTRCTTGAATRAGHRRGSTTSRCIRDYALARALRRRRFAARYDVLRGGEPSRDGRSFRRADPRHGRRRSDAPVQRSTTT